MSECEKPKCYVEDNLRCHEGNPNYENCPFYDRSSSAEAEIEAVRQNNSLFSWTGFTLGMDDVAKFATRSRVKTIVSIGASDAGKTSFLATLYLLLLKGQKIDGYSFAGSFTLGGWEIIASKMRWSGDEQPTFPDHTPRSGFRQPGLLHLALRDKNDRLCDILFADAPGEWFESWAVDRNDSQAEGARWLKRHADSVLMFLDSKRLSTPEDWGAARHQSLTLLDRVSASYSDRSIGIVWAKYDTFSQNLATDVVKENIQKKGITSIFNAISANTPSESQNIMEATTWSIQQALKAQEVPAITVPIDSTHPFLSFRGRSA